MSSVAPETLSGDRIDFSPRVAQNTTVVASPAAAAETIIATVTVPTGIQINIGVLVICTFGVTIGTNGVSYLVKIRRTSVSGTVVYAGNAATATAASLYHVTVAGFDTGAVAGNTENVTLTIASGSAASTVTPLQITCLAF